MDSLSIKRSLSRDPIFGKIERELEQEEKEDKENFSFGITLGKLHNASGLKRRLL